MSTEEESSTSQQCSVRLVKGKGTAPQSACFTQWTRSLADVPLGRRVVKCCHAWGSGNELAGRVFIVAAQTLSPHTGQVSSIFLSAAADEQEYRLKKAHFSGWMSLPGNTQLHSLLDQVSDVMQIDRYERQLFIAHCNEELASHHIVSLHDLSTLVQLPCSWRAVRLGTRVKFEIGRLL